MLLITLFSALSLVIFVTCVVNINCTISFDLFNSEHEILVYVNYSLSHILASDEELCYISHISLSVHTITVANILSLFSQIDNARPIGGRLLDPG